MEDPAFDCAFEIALDRLILCMVRPGDRFLEPGDPPFSRAAYEQSQQKLLLDRKGWEARLKDAGPRKKKEIQRNIGDVNSQARRTYEEFLEQQMFTDIAELKQLFRNRLDPRTDPPTKVTLAPLLRRETTSSAGRPVSKNEFRERLERMVAALPEAMGVLRDNLPCLYPPSTTKATIAPTPIPENWRQRPSHSHKEAAAILGYRDARSIRSLVSQGKLEKTQLNRISTDSIERLLEVRSPRSG